MEKLKLESFFETTAENFNFKLNKGFENLLNIIQSQTEKVPDEVIKKKFQELWLLTNDEWHKKFNLQWGGYPSLAQWLEILVEKPLTDEEIEKKKKEYEENLTIQAKTVGVWLNAPYYERLFCSRYKCPLYVDIKLMLDTYCKVKENLSDDRIKKMAVYLKEKLDQDKALFYDTLKGIAREKQPLLLT
jgi:hypothetical protein